VFGQIGPLGWVAHVASFPQDGYVIVDDLSELEQVVWAAFPRGAWVDASATCRMDGNGQHEKSRESSQVIRAELIKALLLGACPVEPGNAPAIRLRGVLVSGELDLRGAVLNYPLICEDCAFDSLLRFREVSARALRFRRSHLVSFDGVRIRVDGVLDFQGVAIDQGIRLDFGKVSGGATFRDAVIGSGRDGLAMSAKGLNVEGDLVCDRGFVASGEVVMRGARIQGFLQMERARISHPGQVALSADNLSVGCAFEAEGLTINGEFSIRNAHFGGPLILTAAHLQNPGGIALSAIRLSIEGGIWCWEGFSAEGEVRLVGVNLGGNLSLSNATLSNEHGAALNVDRASFGDLDGTNLTVRHGELSLVGTRITGNLVLPWAELGHNTDGESLVAENAVIGGTLFMQHLAADGEIRIRNSQVGGRVLLMEARLNQPGECALRFTRNEIASDMVCTQLLAAGEVRLADSHFIRDVYLDDIQLADVGDVALDAHGLHAAQLTLLPARPIQGTVILDNARLGLLRDDPARWPGRLRLHGLTYGLLEPALSAAERLRWLAKGMDIYQPQPYEQLASMYAQIGQLAEAHRVLYARERDRRATKAFPGRLWGALQDVTVGYGYRPGRAALWLAFLITVGSIVFWTHQPPPIKADAAPNFNPVIYTVDLMLPIVNLGFKNTYNPVGFEQWFSYLLTVAGWILATTIVAGITRILRRK
jgi:hypothetical protein